MREKIEKTLYNLTVMIMNLLALSLWIRVAIFFNKAWLVFGSIIWIILTQPVMVESDEGEDEW